MTARRLLLLACLLAASPAIGAEPTWRERTPEPCPSTFGDDGLPPVSPERFEECRAEMLREEGAIKVYAGLAVLLAVLSAIAAIHWLDRHMAEWVGGEPPDEGQVLPGRTRRPGR